MNRQALGAAALLGFIVPPAAAQFVQQGGKLVTGDFIGSPVQGYSVAVSADGNTALSGGPGDNAGAGAVWVLIRSNGIWLEQAKLVGSGAVGLANQGFSVALSSDGNTAIVGAPGDNNSIGAAWIFTRSNGAWFEQAKLVGSGSAGASDQGYAAALSADGNTAAVGGPLDDNSMGAAWIFTRSNGTWSQQGGKLFGAGGVTTTDTPYLWQGISVALSGDGNTVMIGGNRDNDYTGAVWVFTRSNGVWSQLGNKLVGSGATVDASEGDSVAISGDGNTAVIGGSGDNGNLGAAWIFTRGSNGLWTQQGSKLFGAGAVGQSQQGWFSALSYDGNTALVGGPKDNNSVGAAWAFQRSGGVWSQLGSKLFGNDSAGAAEQGQYVALSADASTAMVGGPYDNGSIGAAWIYVQPVANQFFVSAPGSASAGAAFNFTVTALDPNNNPVTGYNGTVHFSSTDASASLPLNAALANGTGTFSATLRTGGSQTITATDTTLSSITGTSGTISVSGGVTGTEPAGVAPTFGSGSNETMTFTFTDPRGFQDLDVVNVLINNFLDGRNACYLAYSRSAGVLYLVANDGGTLSQGLVPGGTGSVSNSQCTVNAAGSSSNGSGNTLTLIVNLSFAPTFGDNKIVYMAARDLEGGNSGWQALSVWQVPFTPPGTIAVLSLAPPRSAVPSGTPQTFLATLTDSKGAADFGVVNVLVNNFIDGRQACYLAYVASTNTLYLVDDAGDAGGPFAGNILLNGGAATIQNSQCSVSAVGSSAAKNDNNLTLTLNVTFQPAFAGNRIVWVAGRDAAGGNNTDWQAMGTSTLQ